VLQLEGRRPLSVLCAGRTIHKHESRGGAGDRVFTPGFGVWRFKANSLLLFVLKSADEPVQHL
jgi:hypothetical protein